MHGLGQACDDAGMVERWTPERRRQLTRDALVDAAAAVFAEKGFQAASLDEIAQTAGFTRGAVYSNFDDKEDLFLAVFDSRVTAQLGGYAQLLQLPDNDQQSQSERVKDWWNQFVRQDRDWWILATEFLLHSLRNDDARQRLARRQHEADDEVVDMIQGFAARLGVPVPDNLGDRGLAVLFVSTIHGLALRSLYETDLNGGDLFASFVALLMSARDEPQPDT